jgi:hypothetical protein
VAARKIAREELKGWPREPGAEAEADVTPLPPKWAPEDWESVLGGLREELDMARRESRKLSAALDVAIARLDPEGHEAVRAALEGGPR